ncbi:MAG TPA: ATP synthase F1 subunit gamma [Candidatus Binataceae bacterium]|nr:ATP synthase F1 subunit gamma [Candidatus Binataceae bacterium]
MASLKAIRRRIASVKSTQQITKAMKLVAAARLRRAQDALIAARPYSQALARVADSLLTSEGVATGPRPDANKAMLLAVIGSDRGQCGAYNANLLRRADEERARISAEGEQVALFAVGKRPVDHYRRNKVELAERSIDNLPRLATIGLARKIAARMLADYQSGAIERAAIAYTRFRSALSTTPALEQILPVTPPERAQSERGGGAETEIAQPTEYLVEPSREQLIPVVLRSYVEAAVLHALLEAEASEQGMRMSAMDSATNNAGKMINTLTLELNRARQAQITRELMDIVGGAEALRGQSQ